jgi:hypothetical protein
LWLVSLDEFNQEWPSPVERVDLADVPTMDDAFLIVGARGGLGGCGPRENDPQKLVWQRLRALRDLMGEEKKNLDRYKERPAVFIGAYDDATGAVQSFHSVIGGEHAEKLRAG